MVAESLKAAFEATGVAAEVLPEDCEDPAELTGRGWLMVCCATHGEGDVPDHLLPLLSAIEREDADLRGVRYGVVALGDRTYGETFCGGGRRVDNLLSARGARRVGEVLEIDASAQPFPDEAAVAWLPQWLAKAEAERQ
jgi:MioC protein